MKPKPVMRQKLKNTRRGLIGGARRSSLIVVFVLLILGLLLSLKLVVIHYEFGKQRLTILLPKKNPGRLCTRTRKALLWLLVLVFYICKKFNYREDALCPWPKFCAVKPF